MSPSSGLRHPAFAPMKHALAKSFDAQETASSAGLDGAARAHGGNASSLGMTLPSGLSRSQQVFLAQKLLNAPVVPSYVHDEGGMVLDRVVANVGTGGWWSTVTARVRAQRAWNTEQVQEGKAHRALLDASMYALGGRFRANLLQNVAVKAVGELSSVKTITRALTKSFKIGAKEDASAQEPGTKEIARGRVMMEAKIPSHVVSAELSHNERFQTSNAYIDGPKTASVSVASRGRRSINYRVMARTWLGSELAPFEQTADGGMRKPPRKEVLAGVSCEQQAVLWRGRRRRKANSTSAVAGYTALPQVPMLTVGGIYGGMIRKSLEDNYKDGDQIKLQNFTSVSLHAQLGSFARPLLDFTSLNLRLDAGGIGVPHKPLAAETQAPMSLADRLVTMDGRVKASPTSVTVSVGQQILGPLRFRAEVRTSGAEALAATRAGIGALKERKPMAEVRDVFRKEIVSPEVVYGLDCALSPTLGGARVVAWYNVTRQEAFGEIRLFDM